jgi:two-component system cell cycle sensor histidine kinase/response regulator CckA
MIPPGRYGKVTVQDDGIGIDPAVQPRIFEPFYTTKPLGEGTGLGLAAVQGILTQNDGLITVEGGPGSGAAFTIHLPEIERPAVDGDVTRTRATESTPPPTTKPVVQYSVLVVDDEPGMRAVATRALGRAGLNVTVAVDGVDALEIIERDGPPDMLLTDLRMPRMGGVELAGIFRERWPDVPVLMMSGYSVEFLEVSGTVTDRSRLIQKPFDVTELVERLHSVLGRDR